MTSHTLYALIYCLLGASVAYLFQVRRKKLAELRAEQFPGMGSKGFEELIILLKTAYERMLYMGVLFFPLAWVHYSEGASTSKLFFLALIVLLFFSNIPPRNKIIRLLEQHGLSIKQLRETGVWL